MYAGYQRSARVSGSGGTAQAILKDIVIGSTLAIGYQLVAQVVVGGDDRPSDVLLIILIGVDRSNTVFSLHDPVAVSIIDVAGSAARRGNPVFRVRLQGWTLQKLGLSIKSEILSSSLEAGNSLFKVL